VIKTNELSTDAKIDYDKYGNLEMITDDMKIRVTLNPEYACEKIAEKYGKILK
jgi:hypothetical protein